MPCPAQIETSPTGSRALRIMLKTPKLQDTFGYGVEFLLYAVVWNDASGFHMEYRPSIPISICSSSHLQAVVREGLWASVEICSKTSTIMSLLTLFQSEDLRGISARYPVRLTLTIKESPELRRHLLSYQRSSPLSLLSIQKL